LSTRIGSTVTRAPPTSQTALLHFRRDIYGPYVKLVVVLARRSAGAWEP